jgi:hypothetical protein
MFPDIPGFDKKKRGRKTNAFLLARFFKEAWSKEGRA